METENEAGESPEKPSKSKTNNRTIKKCSHVYLQEKFLNKIPKMPPSKDTVVLYLYSNEINEIDNLTGFPNLTSLYLQNNKIEKMENLKTLKHLRKLYIGHNKISVLEGLEHMEHLEELHIEKQCLPDNNPLLVDPRSIFAISETLKILNISHNNVNSLCYLLPLKNLRAVNACFNDLDNIKDVCQTLRAWYHLKEAAFAGNPFTKRHRYREDIIANSYYLECLDGKNISDITRSFIRRFEEEKLIHGSKQSINIADVVPNLPKNYPPPLQKAVSASILKKTECKLLEDLTTFDENDAVYVAWKALPKRKPLAKTPQPLRNKMALNKGKKKVAINSFPQISNI